MIMPCFFKKIWSYKGTHHLGRRGILHLFHRIIGLKPQPDWKSQGQALTITLSNQKCSNNNPVISEMKTMVGQLKVDELVFFCLDISGQETTSGKICLALMRLASKSWWSGEQIPMYRRTRSWSAHRWWKSRTPSHDTWQHLAASQCGWICPQFVSSSACVQNEISQIKKENL